MPTPTGDDLPMRSALTSAVALIVLVAPGCATSGDSPEAERSTPEATPSATPTTSAATTPDSGTTITSGRSDYGSVLFDADQQAIYIWQLERSSTPKCYDDCATEWPPVLTEGKPVASGDIDRAKLGTTERSDGSIQVTYNDHPLYYYAHEEPGEVTCHDVATHGGTWWAVQPSGRRAP